MKKDGTFAENGCISNCALLMQAQFCCHCSTTVSGVFGSIPPETMGPDVHGDASLSSPETLNRTLICQCTAITQTSLSLNLTASKTDFEHTCRLGVVNEILGPEPAPEEWKHSSITKLPRKGDLSDSNSCTSVTLLSVAGQVFHSMLLCRTRDTTDILLREGKIQSNSNRTLLSEGRTVNIKRREDPK